MTDTTVTAQQTNNDLQLQLETARYDNQLEFENARHANQQQLEAQRAKLEAIRLAKETLIENARSKPADSRDVTAADITAFAATLVNYVNG
jgi:hypothetical protein